MNPEEIIHAYENGERDLQPLLEKMGWESWLGVAELGIVMDSDIVEFLEDKLTPAESKVLDLVKKRVAGELDLDSIEEALKVARSPETRDLALEGRLRMERGLVHFENGVHGHIGASRVSWGKKCGLTWEVHGTKGTIC